MSGEYTSTLKVTVGEVVIETTQESSSISSNFRIEAIQEICLEAKILHDGMYSDCKKVIG